MSSEWDEFAGGWDSDEDVVKYSELALQSLGEVFQIEGRDVFDFGCGTGRLTEKLALLANRVVGLDTSPAMLAVLDAKQLPNVTTIGEELTSELIKTHKDLQPGFDLVVASSVCGFLPDYELTLGLLKQLLVPGGLFVQWDWHVTDEQADQGLTTQRVLCSLDGAGFESVSVTSPFSMTRDQSERVVLMGVGANG
jgi:predicted TPR repeat methyltransferase